MIRLLGGIVAGYLVPRRHDWTEIEIELVCQIQIVGYCDTRGY